LPHGEKFNRYFVLIRPNMEVNLHGSMGENPFIYFLTPKTLLGSVIG